MKTISTIGFEIPGHAKNQISIRSSSSLSDTEILLFAPDLGFEGAYYSNENIQGKPLYSSSSSTRIMEDINHWNHEIANFLQHGGTLIVILKEKKDFYIQSGPGKSSGNGRSIGVTSYNNYDFLPHFGLTYHAASGKNILPLTTVVQDLYQTFEVYFSYKTYLKTEKNMEMAFTTKNRDRMLGTVFAVGKGYVLLIPDLDFEVKDLMSESSGKWTAKAEPIGKSFLGIISEIDKVIRKLTEATPRPHWLKDGSYKLTSADNIIRKINKNKAEIRKKLEKNQALTAELLQEESLKDLLFENGKKLEDAVIRALTILGFKAENYDDGELELDQIIISPEGHRFIGECEGKDNKDIDVSKFRQLLDGLNADFEKDAVSEKAYGILFGNPQRLIDPKDRTLSFTAKCRSGAKRESIALIRTEDLFHSCRHIAEQNDLDYAKACREAILQQLGDIVVFPTPPTTP